jgi:hypothetical protein
MANPRGLRASSGNSRPGVTVENRMKIGVFSPTLDKKLAFWTHVRRLLVPDCGCTYGERGYVFGALEVTESSGSARVHHTFQLLRSVKVLLLLEQEDIAGHWNTTDSLAVCSVDC